MILIVDDQPDIREVLAVFFKREGYAVEEAASGEEGIEKFVRVKPKLVFLDIRLPDCDGIQVLKQIKTLNKDSYVIMITAYRDAEKVVEAFRLGAYDCIFKPFDFSYIKTAVMSTIGSRKKE